MSELAQRIVASHKAAAKRAVFHLGKTRKLKMSATESLELVACVLGVANWQTLLALAKEGKGPRIDDGTLAAAVPEQKPAAATEKSVIERLADYYGTDHSWGEHPSYPRKDWAYEVDNGDTGASYWQYVFGKMDEVGEMYPWERDASFAVKLARAAGMAVQPGEDCDDDWELSDPHGLAFVASQATEEQMWNTAADDVKKHLIHVFQLSPVVFNHMSEKAWFTAAANYFTEGPKVPEAEQHREPAFDDLEGRMMFPGEMTKDARKFSEAVAICQGVNIEALYSEAKMAEGKYWVAGFNFYRTEAEAWEMTAKAIRGEVIESLGYDLDLEGLGFETCFDIAIENSDLAFTFTPGEVK